MARPKKPPKKKRGPKPKGRADLFVAEYMIDHCAAKAAVRCGFSKTSARTTGSKLLTRYAEEIQKSIAKSNASLEITAERVLAELAKIAFVEIKEDMSSSWLKAKVHSLELLCKRLGLLVERQEVSLVNPVQIFIPDNNRVVNGVASAAEEGV